MAEVISNPQSFEDYERKEPSLVVKRVDFTPEIDWDEFWKSYYQLKLNSLIRAEQAQVRAEQAIKEIKELNMKAKA